MLPRTQGHWLGTNRCWQGQTVSDVSQAPGWWMASDGKWYPPELRRTEEQGQPDQVSLPSFASFLAQRNQAGVGTAPAMTPRQGSPLTTASGQGLTDMSSAQPGPGWWLASDGSWYSPELHPSRRSSPPASAFGSTPLAPAVGTALNPLARSGSSSAGGGETVSSRVPSLRTFVLVGVAVATVQVFIYFAMRKIFSTSIADLSVYSGTESHLVITLAYLAQGTVVLGLVFYLTLLLSRSVQVVNMLLRVAVGLNILDGILSLLARSYGSIVFCAVIVVYLLHVIKEVGAAHLPSSGTTVRSRGNHYGYSTFEIVLAGYLVLLIVVSGVLIVSSYRNAAAVTTPNNAKILYQSGAASGSGTSDPAPSRYVAQTVVAHDFTVTLSFDPHSSAVIDYQPSRQVHGYTISGVDEVAITGDQLHSSSKLTVEVSKLGPEGTVGSINPTVCRQADAPVTSDWVPLFDASIMGQSSLVCGFSGYTAASAYFEAASTWYFLQFGTPSGVSSNDSTAKLAMETVASSLRVK
jgi:hypothetical protein